MTDYEELVKKLRDLHRDPRPDSAVWLFDNQIALYDAAVAIEALRKDLATLQKCYEIADTTADEVLKQLPKRGEWIYEDLDNFRKYKVTCPHCGAWFVGNYDAYDDPSEFLYCPHCGNICNPTNLDWENELKEREKEAMAKMEVQE